MPLVIVKMLEGRSVEQKRRLAKEITNVVVKFTGAAEEQVDVIIEDGDGGIVLIRRKNPPVGWAAERATETPR